MQFSLEYQVRKDHKVELIRWNPWVEDPELGVNREQCQTAFHFPVDLSGIFSLPQLENKSTLTKFISNFSYILA